MICHHTCTLNQNPRQIFTPASMVILFTITTTPKFLPFIYFSNYFMFTFKLS